MIQSTSIHLLCIDQLNLLAQFLAKSPPKPDASGRDSGRLPPGQGPETAGPLDFLGGLAQTQRAEQHGPG